jgi:hypothetical protein
LAEAEKRQAGNYDYRIGKTKAEFDHERADEIRQNFPRYDTGRLDALQLDGFHVIAFGYVEGGCPHDSGHLGDVPEADGENDEPELGADGPDDEQCQDDLREGEEDIHPAHDHRVGAPAQVSGLDALESTEADADDSCRQCHDEEHPAPGEHA